MGIKEEDEWMNLTCIMYDSFENYLDRNDETRTNRKPGRSE